MNRVITISIFLVVSLTLSVIFVPVPVCYAQDDLDDEEQCEKTNNRKALKMYEKAMKISRKEPAEAFKLLKDATNIEPDFYEAYYVMARLSMGHKSYKTAKKYLLKVIEICPSYNIYAYYYLGDICYGEDEFDEARKHFSEFIKYPDEIKTDRHYNYAEKMLGNARFYAQIYSNPVPFEPKVVDGICTDVDEYLPAISADNEIAFFTRRYEVAVKGNLAKKKVEKFTYSMRVDGNFDSGTPMPPPFNKGDNEGGATLTIDNTKMYFTICKNTTANYYNCDIYSADYIYNDPEEFIEMMKEEEKEFGKREFSIDGIPEYRWDNIVNLNEGNPNEKAGVNTLTTWESQPSIAPDGKTLYFTSSRPGGYGGLDIYKTTYIDSLGYWGAPVNLGNIINTEGNEKSPFIHPDNQTLYFSSDGHKGLGSEDNFDIFITKKIKPADSAETDIKWRKPVNIGYPINTEADDIGFFVSTDGKTGYFSSEDSERLKGRGGWDLYHFPLYEGARPEKVLFLKGKLKDDGGEVITEAKIELKNLRTKEVTQVEVESEIGKYAAVVTLEEDDDDFIMNVKKEGRAFTTRYISTKDTVYDAPATIDIEVKPIEIGDAYRLNNINFETNSANVLSEKSMTILDEFVNFLNENPTIHVAIHGHTDNVGSNENNLDLSKRRSKAVNDYLILSGINGNRLSYKGFGESKPIAGNDTEKGKALNRRTEFVIVSM